MSFMIKMVHLGMKISIIIASPGVELPILKLENLTLRFKKD